MCPAPATMWSGVGVKTKGMLGKEEMTKGFNSEKPVFAKLNLEPPTKVDANGFRKFWKARRL